MNMYNQFYRAGFAERAVVVLSDIICSSFIPW